MMDFNEKITLNVGTSEPFDLLHITDTHLCLANGQDNPRKQALAKNRGARFTAETGIPAEDLYREAVAYANAHNMVVAHTGDLIDFTSRGHEEKVPELLSLADRMVFATGNHEFSQYVGEAFEDAGYRSQSFAAVQAAFQPHGLDFSARVINGVNLIALDNSYYGVTEAQLARFREEAEKGLPMLLFVHNPFYCESLRDFMRAEHKNRVLYTVGTPLEEMECYDDHRYRQQITTPQTWRFLRYMYSCENLKAVVAGHLHEPHVGLLPSGIPQIITGGQYLGQARVIEVR